MPGSPRPVVCPRIGERFGKRTVIADLGLVKRKHTVQALCDCGRVDSVAYTLLVHGKALRCLDCRPRRVKHGCSNRNRTPEYSIWLQIRNRCRNPSCKSYADYGGRGIIICPEWDDFSTFLQDMGERPSLQHSIDRIRNDGPYSRDNCRWATREQQNNNARRNVRLEWDGKNLTVAQWARETGLSEGALEWRMKSGWSVEDTLTRPARRSR